MVYPASLDIVPGKDICRVVVSLVVGGRAWSLWCLLAPYRSGSEHSSRRLLLTECCRCPMANSCWWLSTSQSCLACSVSVGVNSGIDATRVNAQPSLACPGNGKCICRPMLSYFHCCNRFRSATRCPPATAGQGFVNLEKSFVVDETAELSMLKRLPSHFARISDRCEDFEAVNQESGWTRPSTCLHRVFTLFINLRKRGCDRRTPRRAARHSSAGVRRGRFLLVIQHHLTVLHERRLMYIRGNLRRGSRTNYIATSSPLEAPSPAGAPTQPMCHPSVSVCVRRGGYPMSISSMPCGHLGTSIGGFPVYFFCLCGCAEKGPVGTSVGVSSCQFRNM
ncbi:hypothetical protein GE09DRAFT_680155 [Coniochaeta sp. 2T2.1]|nr:hypothetical protein GE09DRAFT_680155 [Coniochaeta sp. 2T2.1]